MRKSAKLRRKKEQTPTKLTGRKMAGLETIGLKLKAMIGRVKSELRTERPRAKSRTVRSKSGSRTEWLRTKSRAEGQRAKLRTKRAGSKRFVGRTTKQRSVLLLGVAFSVALICIFTVLGVRASMRNYVERYDGDIFLTGISIDGIDVSGMTMNQALEELRSRLRASKSSSIVFNLENGRSFSGTLDDIGLRIDGLEAIVREAFDYRRDVSLAQRVRILRRSNDGRLEVEFPLTFQVSQDNLIGFLESHMEAYLNVPISARLESGSYGVTIIPDQIGEVFDFDKAYQGISHYIDNYWNRADVSFDLEVIHEEADVVAGQLEGMTDLLGTFTTTFYDSNESRAQNVETGAGHINHLFMEPGDELSACTLMRPYTEENGYAYGSMFAGNLVIDAIGGGVCQVVSTLYNALLHAEIEIVQRNSHSMPVDYVPLSMDAAVAEDLLDLRWRNNQSTPIYIESIVIPGQRITYNIFGRETRPENRRIEFVNESTWGDVPEGTQFVASEYGIGAMWLISEARPPISARLFKVIYIDEEEVERIQVNSSYYMESPRIWSVGTASDNPDSTARMLGAIGSQSYEYVRSTISQILTGGQAQE